MRPRVIDVSKLTHLVNGSKNPLWWGFWGLILVEATVFASLVSAYFYLRMGAPSWPPPGIKPPQLVLPTINTGLLVLSSVFVHQADTGIKKGNLRKLKIGLGGGIALAMVFITIKAIEYSQYDYRWDSHAYGSIVWTITGFHTAHVISLILKTIVMLAVAFTGFFDEKRNIGVEVNGMYWHFVVAVWIPLYLVLYYTPRIG